MFAAGLGSEENGCAWANINSGVAVDTYGGFLRSHPFRSPRHVRGRAAEAGRNQAHCRWRAANALSAPIHPRPAERIADSCTQTLRKSTVWRHGDTRRIRPSHPPGPTVAPDTRAHLDHALEGASRAPIHRNIAARRASVRRHAQNQDVSPPYPPAGRECAVEHGPVTPRAPRR